MLSLKSALLEPRYLVLHLYCVLYSWTYQLCILFAHRFLYHIFSPSTKAFLDHEYKVITHFSETLLTRLRDPFSLFARPDGPFWFFGPHTHSKRSSDSIGPLALSRIHANRSDTPAAAFLRIIYAVQRIHTSAHLDVHLYDQVQNQVRNFWRRGITGASKPDHFLFGGRWYIKDLPDPRKHLGNDPVLCAIAASTAEQMAEVFNWRIGLGIRRDLKLIRARRPHWDKNLMPCLKESAPEWCKGVGPAPVQTVVDKAGGEDMERYTDESKAITLSPSFQKRNLLIESQFLYFP